VTPTDLRLSLTFGLAALNAGMTLVVWYYYLRIWWTTRAMFEGAVPFHVITVGVSYLIFATLALERLEGWRGSLVLAAYALSTSSLLWVLWYERTRFLQRRR